MSEENTPVEAPAKKPRASRKKVEPKPPEQVEQPQPEQVEQPQPEQVEQPQPEVGETGQPAAGLSEYAPKHRPLKAAGLDQHAENAKREAELQAARDEHDRRTLGRNA